MKAAASVQDRINQIDLRELVRRKLENPNLQLDFLERIALLVGCINMGEESVSQITQENLERPITVLGNAGSGKSTLVNYLAGCQLQSVPGMALGLNTQEDVIITKSDSNPIEVMKIGHKKVSERFMPAVASVQGNAYIDCPDFLGRGTEINIANIVNTRRVMIANGNLRLIFLINYHALLADKARALRDTIAIAQKLFGSRELFNTNKGAILVGITKIPRDSSGVSLDILKDWMKTEDGVQYEPYEKDVIETFAEKLFIYDPLERVDSLRFAGGLNRNQLLQKIENMNSMVQPEEVLNISLTPEDEQGLRGICEGMSNWINESLENQLYDNASTLLEYTYTIRKVNHKIVEKLLTNCKQTVVKHFSELVKQLDIELAKNLHELTDEAIRLLEIIDKWIRSFGPQDVEYFSDAIGLTELKLRYESHRARVEFYQEEFSIEALVVEFNHVAFGCDFEKADNLLKEIIQKVADLNQKYRTLGLVSSVQVKFLAAKLERFKDYKQKLEAIEEEIRVLKKEMAEKVEALDTQNAQLVEEHKQFVHRQEVKIAELNGELKAIRNQYADQSRGGCIIL